MCTNGSQNPPKCRAAGGLNFHTISTFIRCNFAAKDVDAFRSAMLDWRLLFESTNDFPQWEMNLLGFPLRQTNRLMHLIVESVLRSLETSGWTALTTKHVNSSTWRLNSLPLFLTGSGPIKSSPVVSKTNWLSLGYLSWGNSAILGMLTSWIIRRHGRQCLMVCFNTARHRSIQ